MSRTEKKLFNSFLEIYPVVVLCATLTVGALFVFLRYGQITPQKPFDRADSTVINVTGQLVHELLDAGYGQVPINPEDPVLKKRLVLISSGINDRSAQETINKLIYLDGLDNSMPIDLFIATNGGEQTSAFAIIDVMQLIDAPVNTWAVGNCNSAGALILVAGTGQRYATPNAIIGIHMHESRYYPTSRLETRIAHFWETNTQHTIPSRWLYREREDFYYLDASEALQYRVVDSIVSADYRRPVQKAQERLTLLGYDVGPVDGVIGARTADAIKKFQTNNHLTATGALDDETKKHLEI